MLTREEQMRVEDAIRAAEARTAGEIVVVLAAQASSYRSLPALIALLVALLVPWPLVTLTLMPASWIYLLQLATALVLTLLLSIGDRRHALVPGFVKRRRAQDEAMREFSARGLTRTAGRTGVLIYIAAAEHYAEVIADTGIAERVDDGVWRGAIEDLVEAIKAGRPGDGLVAAVHRVGEVLAVHAPRSPDDRDELPNRVFLS